MLWSGPTPTESFPEPVNRPCRFGRSPTREIRRRRRIYSCRDWSPERRNKLPSSPPCRYCATCALSLGEITLSCPALPAQPLPRSSPCRILGRCRSPLRHWGANARASPSLPAPPGSCTSNSGAHRHSPGSSTSAAAGREDRAPRSSFHPRLVTSSILLPGQNGASDCVGAQAKGRDQLFIGSGVNKLRLAIALECVNSDDTFPSAWFHPPAITVENLE